MTDVIIKLCVYTSYKLMMNCSVSSAVYSSMFIFCCCFVHAGV